MADGKVVVEAFLDETGVQKGVSNIKASLKSINDVDGGITWNGIKAGDDATKKLASSLQGAGGALTLGVTVPMAATAASSVEMAATFEQSMAQVQVATGESSDGMQVLEDYAKQMGAETMYSAQECGGAMLELAKGGLTSADIQGGALTNTLTLAAAGNMELGDAANAVVQAMGSFGLSADESARATNSLAGAANASSADVSGLTEGLSQCSAVANNAGWSIEDTTAILGEFADAGITGSDAGTSLKTMLQSIEAPSSSAAACMEEYGLNVRDSNGNIKDAASLSQEFQDKLGGLDAAQQQEALSTIFGSDAMRAGTVLMNQGADGLQKYTDATNSSESATDMAAATMSGTQGALESLSGSFDNLKLTLGEALAPAISTVAGWLQNICDWFTNLDPAVQGVVMVIGGLVASIGPLLLIGGTVLGSISTMVSALGTIKAAMTAFKVAQEASTIAQAAFNLVMDANPIVLIILAIVALVAALVWFFTQTELGQQIWQAFTDWLVAAWQWLCTAAQQIWDIIVGIFTVAGNTVQMIWQAVCDFFAAIPGAIVGFFSWIGDGIASYFENCANIIKNIFLAVVEFFANIPTEIYDFFASIPGIGDFFVAAVEVVTNAGQNIIDFFKGIPDAIVGFFANMHIEFPHINMPHFGIEGDFNLDPANFSVPHLTIDWYAKGGVFNGASVIGIGEAGPEAALPLNSKTYGAIASGIADEGGTGGKTNDEAVKLLKLILEAMPTDWVMKCDKREIARLVAEVS